MQSEEYWVGLRSAYNEGNPTWYWSDNSKEDWKVYSYPRYINMADPELSVKERKDSVSELESDEEDEGGEANFVSRCGKMYPSGIKAAQCSESHYFICKIPSK